MLDLVEEAAHACPDEDALPVDAVCCCRQGYGVAEVLELCAVVVTGWGGVGGGGRCGAPIGAPVDEAARFLFTCVELISVVVIAGSPGGGLI